MHQAGIVTPAQQHTYFAAFDLTTDKRDAVVALLKTWTDAAARLTAGKLVEPGDLRRVRLGHGWARPGAMASPPAPGAMTSAPAPGELTSAPPATGALEAPPAGGTAPPAAGTAAPAAGTAGPGAAASDGYDTASAAQGPTLDSAETLGLDAARLTITFGFGPGLFEKDGKDRYGLAARRPEALADLPRFNGDQLAPERTGGDLSVQACADDPLVAFHAVRQLARLADGVAQVRWTQTGFMSRSRERQRRRAT